MGRLLSVTELKKAQNSTRWPRDHHDPGARLLLCTSIRQAMEQLGKTRRWIRLCLTQLSGRFSSRGDIGQAIASLEVASLSGDDPAATGALAPPWGVWKRAERRKRFWAQGSKDRYVSPASQSSMLVSETAIRLGMVGKGLPGSFSWLIWIKVDPRTNVQTTPLPRPVAEDGDS
jgi:hypothetical protein